MTFLTNEFSLPKGRENVKFIDIDTTLITFLFNESEFHGKKKYI
jgi:hypothetical protein